MSFYHLPHPWNPGYAIPKYVMAEPPGEGTFTTTWLPRRTISQLVPDYLAKPTAKKLTGRRDAQLGSLGGSSLGAEVYTLVPTGAEPTTTAPKPAGTPVGTLAVLGVVGYLAYKALK